MATKGKQLRRNHLKSPTRRRQGRHPSHATGLERLCALESAYLAWRSLAVPHHQTGADWAGLVAMLETYAAVGQFTAEGPSVQWLALRA